MLYNECCSVQVLKSGFKSKKEIKVDTLPQLVCNSVRPETFAVCLIKTKVCTRDSLEIDKKSLMASTV